MPDEKCKAKDEPFGGECEGSNLFCHRGSWDVRNRKYPTKYTGEGGSPDGPKDLQARCWGKTPNHADFSKQSPEMAKFMDAETPRGPYTT